MGDDAEFSLGKFLTGMGDKDVQVSPWKPTNERERQVRSRVVRYIHPVNAPMAPPEAKARKEQTYQRLGDFGFIVETKTFVDDVPLTDCFFVKDRLVVQASKPPGEGLKENPGRHILLSMEFELEFVKSTMFRGIITRTTNKEITDFEEKLITYMATNLGEELPALLGKSEEDAKIQVAVEEPSFLPSTLAMASVTHLLLVVVIMMQLWVLTEIYTMKSSIRRLETAENQYFNEAYFASHRK
jgi:VAD1 Analog of StAR-related lipid transfer domain